MRFRRVTMSGQKQNLNVCCLRGQYVRVSLSTKASVGDYENVFFYLGDLLSLCWEREIEAAHQDPSEGSEDAMRQHPFVQYDVTRPWQNMTTSLRAAQTQEMFLNDFRNTFRVQDTQFVSIQMLYARGKTSQHLGNTSATLPPHCVLVMPRTSTCNIQHSCRFIL